MSLEPGRIVPARFIDAVSEVTDGTGAKKVFGVTCGGTLCDPSAILQGRWIDTHRVGGGKVFGVISQCCQYPAGYTPDWVERATFPPYGISRHLLLRVRNTETCAELHCLEQLTEYVGGTEGGYWEWTIGPVVVRMEVDDTQASGLRFDVSGSNCSVNLTNQPALICPFPLTVHQDLTPASAKCCDCCPNTTARVNLEIIGYCDNIRLARFIDVVWNEEIGGYQRVFGYADCCEAFECPPLDCCLDFNCTMLLCFTALGGGCSCLDGLCVELTPSTLIPGVSMGWENTGFSNCSCQFGAELECLGLGSSGATEFRFVLSSNRNCSVPDSTFTVNSFCSRDFDIEFEVTLECPTCEPSPPAPTPPCCDCGNYGYLVRITRAACGGSYYGPSKLTMVATVTPELDKVRMRIPAKKNVAVVTMAVGKLGDDLLAVSEPVFVDYAERIGADYIAIKSETVSYPLGVKFAVHALFDRYERVLFLDADVILDRDCPDLFDLVPPGAVGVHDDLPYLREKSWVAAGFERLYESQGWTEPIPATVYNSGVVVADRATRDVWLAPEKPFPGGHLGEQTVVNANISRLDLPVCRLANGLNRQWWMTGDATGPVHVWHFANCPDKDRARLMMEKRKEVARV